jgi:sugar-specific transcriptional regulator TrmB
MDKTTDKTVKAHVVNVETGEITNQIFEGDSILRKESQDALKKLKEVKEETQKQCETLIWNMSNFMKMNITEVRLWMDDLNQAEKAFLFSIVPCVSYDDCHLQTHDGKDIGTEELVKITKLSRSLVYETIESLIKKDILYKGKNSKNRQYFVNPWIFCKGNRINRVLKTMFKNYKIRILGGKQWKDVKDKEK